MKRVIIAGSRTVRPDVAALDLALRMLDPAGLLWVPDEWEVIVCGMAPGADLAGKAWAEATGKRVERHPITPRMVSQHGKYLAPKMRNREMAEVADGAVLLWEGTSGGTADMCIRMVARNKPVVVIPWKSSTVKRRA